MTREAVFLPSLASLTGCLISQIRCFENCANIRLNYYNLTLVQCRRLSCPVLLPLVAFYTFLEEMAVWRMVGVARSNVREFWG